MAAAVMEGGISILEGVLAVALVIYLCVFYLLFTAGLAASWSVSRIIYNALFWPFAMIFPWKGPKPSSTVEDDEYDDDWDNWRYKL